MKKLILMALLLPCILHAQTYMSDLQKGDITGVERKLGLLNTSFSQEPILARYLENRGAKADIVETLIKKGAKIETISPTSKLTPLVIALEEKQEPDIIKTMLRYGARFNMTMQGEWGTNLIDYALYSNQFRSAYFIIKSNAKLAAGNRLGIDRKYSSYVAVLTDQIESTKKIIAADDLSEKTLWNLAVCGSSKNVLKLLTKLYPQPNIEESTLELLAYDPQLIKYMAAIGFSTSFYRELWDYVIEKHDSDLAISFINIDQNGAAENLVRLLAKDPAWLVDLVDQGVKINKTNALWETAIEINQGNVYSRLIKCGPVPDDLFTKSMHAGDETLSSILESGLRIAAEDLNKEFKSDTAWNWMIKNKFNQTLTFLLKNGYTAPEDSIILALAYSDTAFPLMVKSAKNINKERLGSVAYDDLLAIEIAIKEDRWRNLAIADDHFKIFDPEKPVKENKSYPQDRERSHWKYYCLLKNYSHERRGYAWAGYNDFLTNNFNVLCFLIAAKYDKPELAEYILKRDTSIAKGSVFTLYINESPDTTFRYSVKEFLKMYYSKSTVTRLLQ